MRVKSAIQMPDLANQARFTTSHRAHEETVVRGWMPHFIGFVIGAVVFVAAHAVEARHWSDWFNGEYEPWFLNSGRAVLFTLGLLWMASALTTALARSPRHVRGLAICGGAFLAMAIVLFTGPGPGTLFPITLGLGGLALVGSILAGAGTGTAINVERANSSAPKCRRRACAGVFVEQIADDVDAQESRRRQIRARRRRRRYPPAASRSG